MQNLPEKFISNIRTLLKEESEYFFSSLLQPPTTSIRLNPLKPAEYNFPLDQPIPWCSHAYFLNQRPSFIADPLFHAGAYYVQEASSTIIQNIIRQIKEVNNGPLSVLDVCAAPGGKSTAALSALDDNDVLVANEVIKSRVTALEQNLMKWGRMNVVITNNDPEQFLDLHSFFDVIIVDAPCSGEGMFRKDANAIDEWSEEHVAMCSLRQRRILSQIINCIKPGGVLIYSTCTFNQVENEENVNWLMNHHALQPYLLNIDYPEIVKTKQNNQLDTFRFYPHKTKGEGLFIAALQVPLKSNHQSINKSKASKIEILPNSSVNQVSKWLNANFELEWININGTITAFPKVLINNLHTLVKCLNVKYIGTPVGELMKNKFLPHHALALSVHLSNDIPKLELNYNQAIRYLKKDHVDVRIDKTGIVLATFQNLGLGWGNMLPNRLNNYLPSNWRILKDIPYHQN